MKLYPLLKPMDWPHQKDTLNRLLAPTEGEMTAYNALLAYGYDDPVGFRFLSKNHDLALTPEEIEEESLQNLAELTVQKNVIPLSNFKMILCDNSFFAAEKILDAEFMQELQADLGTDLILVAVPRRSLLMASNGLMPDEVISQFAQMAIMAYLDEEPVNPPISPMIYMLQDGEIVGFLDLEMSNLLQELKARLGDAKHQDEADAPASDIYVKAVVAEEPNTGKKMIVVMAGGTNTTELEMTIRHTLLGLHTNVWQNEEYSGLYKVILLHNLTPDTDDIRFMMSRISNDFNKSDIFKMVSTPENAIPMKVEVAHSIDAVEPEDDNVAGEAVADE